MSWSNLSPLRDQFGSEYHPVAFAKRARYLHLNNNDRSDPEGRQSGEALLVPQATAMLCVAVRDGAYGHGRALDATERVATKNFAGYGMPVPPALPEQTGINSFIFDVFFAARLPGKCR